MHDVIVVGGGVVGLSTAYHLVASGARALLLDRADAGRATAAGAGIIASESNSGESEAWFNFAALLRDAGKIGAARQHLKRAIAIDPDYADAIYNLASLEFDAGALGAARTAWARYLELDQDSEWARTASRGIAFVDLNERKSAG